MPPSQIFDVLDICLLGDSKASSFKPADTEVHSIERDDLSGLRTNVVDKVREVKNAKWNFSFKFRLSNKNDGRRYVIGRKKFKNFLYCTDVPKVLKNWILELELLVEQDLSPVRLLGISKDPAVVVLGLYDKIPNLERRIWST